MSSAHIHVRSLASRKKKKSSGGQLQLPNIKPSPGSGGPYQAFTSVRIFQAKARSGAHVFAGDDFVFAGSVFYGDTIKEIKDSRGPAP